jgi:predicted small lipoprotein YifL
LVARNIFPSTFASLKHKPMKNVFSVLMASVMLFSVACGGEKAAEETPAVEEVVAEEPAAAPVDTAAAATTDTAAAAPAAH